VNSDDGARDHALMAKHGDLVLVGEALFARETMAHVSA